MMTQPGTKKRIGQTSTTDATGTAHATSAPTPMATRIAAFATIAGGPSPVTVSRAGAAGWPALGSLSSAPPFRAGGSTAGR